MVLRSGAPIIFLVLTSSSISSTVLAQMRPDPLAQSSRRSDTPPQEQGLSDSGDSNADERHAASSSDSSDSSGESAALVSSVAGALQLGLNLGILHYTSLSADYDVGGDADFSNTSWGFARNPITLEAGYGLNDRMLIGGLLQLGGVNWSSKRGSLPGNETSDFNFAIGPKFDFHFLPDSRFNPFVGAIFTIGSNSIDWADDTDDSRLVFNLLLRAGARYFLFDQLSVDPSLTFGAVLGSGSTHSGTIDYDYGFSGVQFAIWLGLSYWLK